MLVHELKIILPLYLVLLLEKRHRVLARAYSPDYVIFLRSTGCALRNHLKKYRNEKNLIQKSECSIYSHLELCLDAPLELSWETRGCSSNRRKMLTSAKSHLCPAPESKLFLMGKLCNTLKKVCVQYFINLYCVIGNEGEAWIIKDAQKSKFAISGQTALQVVYVDGFDSILKFGL